MSQNTCYSWLHSCHLLWCGRLYKSLSSRQVAGSGFTLVELLVGMATGAVVLAGIAAVVVADIRNQRTSEEITRLRTMWSQAVNLIDAEAQIADRIIPVPGSPGCGLSSGDVKLALSGAPSNWTSVYAIRAITTAEQSLWQGPFLLVRCGRPFTTASPELSVDTSGAVFEGVVAEGLPNANAFVVAAPIYGANPSATQVSRDASATLSLQIGSALFSNSFRVRMPSNPIYGLNADVTLGLQSCGQPLCLTSALPNNAGNVREWRITATGTVQGSPTDEDIVYFDFARGSATISTQCDRASCVITSGGITATTKDVDVLAFTDEEIRL